MHIKKLDLKNISKNFIESTAPINIFNNIYYTFESSQSYAIMGPSGIGKSTLLHIMAGIEKPTDGTLEINGQTINFHSFEKRIEALHKNIGILFQQPSLISELNVLENVMLTALAHNQLDDASKEHALELLRSINLEEKAQAAIHTLSGGQQQRVAILRAIFHKPSFLIADEPTGNLDKNSAHQIMDLLISYQKIYNMGLIISTHDLEIAQRCDVILKIANHKLII
jgi:ABC-type lipoprotein export system ATPase subunit